MKDINKKDIDPLAKFPNLKKIQQEDGLLPPFNHPTNCISAYERRRMKFNGIEDPEIEERFEKLKSLFHKISP